MRCYLFTFDVKCQISHFFCFTNRSFFLYVSKMIHPEDLMIHPEKDSVIATDSFFLFTEIHNFKGFFFVMTLNVETFTDLLEISKHNAFYKRNAFKLRNASLKLSGFMRMKCGEHSHEMYQSSRITSVAS